MSYNHQNLKYAKQLRAEMTPWERKLWYCFLSKYPVRFQRQKPKGNYIVDFYCAQAKLVVELDGSGHFDPEAIKKDEHRTLDLERIGLKVMRFSNRDIDKNFYGIRSVIDQTVNQRLGQLPQPPHTAAAAPSERGGQGIARNRKESI